MFQQRLIRARQHQPASTPSRVRGAGQRICASAALALSFAAGCSDDPVDLGSDDIAVDRSALSSYAAVWTGYVEGGTFPSGSDRIRLELDEQGNGQLTLGEGEPLPMPTDPENPFNEAVPGDLSPLGLLSVMEGFPYVISGALVEEERLRASTSPTVYLDAACALYEPVAPPAPDQPARCLPNVASSSNQGTGCFLADESRPNGPGYPHEVSCAKYQLCLLDRVCECDATTCFNVRDTDDIAIDAAFDPDDTTRLVGSMGLRTIRLRRD